MNRLVIGSLSGAAKSSYDDAEEAGARVVRARLVAARRAARRSSDARGCSRLPPSPRRCRRPRGSPRAATATAAAASRRPPAPPAWRTNVSSASISLFFGNAAGHRHVDGAAARLEPVGAGLQPAGDVVGVAHQEVGEVDEDAAVAGAGDLKRPQHRPRERVVDVANFRRRSCWCRGTDSSAAPSAARGPTRSNLTMREPVSAPRSMPMSFEPSPVPKPVECSTSVSSFGISTNSRPPASSQ